MLDYNRNKSYAKFQSTLPRGERPGAERQALTDRNAGFNPRSRVGSDLAFCQV